jgi:hypothetical protein
MKRFSLVRGLFLALSLPAAARETLAAHHAGASGRDGSD